MNRFLTYLLLALTLGLAGCHSNEPDLIAESGEANQKGQSGLYDEIVARANHYYAMLPGKTRAATPQVSGITPINPGTTRSENGDETPIYYIVNYENEEGFVIVGGNDTADPMVAVSDEGNFSLADTIENKSLASFVKGLETPTAAIDTLKPFPTLPANVSVDPMLDEEPLIIMIIHSLPQQLIWQASA